MHVGVLSASNSALVAGALGTVDGIEVTTIDGPGELHHFIDTLDVLVVNNRFYHANVAELVGRAPRLRYIHFISAGFDNLLLHGAPRRLPISSGGAAHASGVAEHALALLLGLMRQLPVAERNRAAGIWEREQIRTQLGSLEGATVLVVGFGAIGRRVAELVRAFRARVVGIMRSEPEPDVATLADAIVKPAALHAALAEADAVVICVPLSPETEKLIDAAALAAMKPSAFLVNVARGGVIDEAALVAALRERRIAGAGLDVFEPEPLPPESPLWQLDNVILTPHIAGMGNASGKDRITALACENVLRFRDGRPPLNPVPGWGQVV